MNAPGQPTDHVMFHVPVRYLPTKGNERPYNRGADFVLLAVNKRSVMFGWRSSKTNRVGMQRRAKLETDKRGTYFVHRGQKVFLFKGASGWTM